MKKIITIVVLFFGLTATVSAQDKMMKKSMVTKTVTLEQTKGEFTQKGLTLAEGTYVFEIENNNVGTDVGFVLAPKGKLDPANHIKEAYVTAPVKNNTSGNSKQVTLKKGTYTYFCPLNKTPQYTLIVE